ncbi:hypothetical protein ACOSQ2_029147 [Xanthoceras sorbifolium]|uniref:Carbohydrate kinase FGGY C-terminal domain-containing protein n=1 Tax=Xanthoceras sorbifolium TaxID=99658 RepID=A0ABQ8HCA9_9ROSI|nr:hypothetical protein JRO89_XS12G0118500 [Xanthoceras sorbifolium]
MISSYLVHFILPSIYIIVIHKNLYTSIHRMKGCLFHFAEILWIGNLLVIFPCLLNSWIFKGHITNRNLIVYSVGFHRYILDNFTGETLDGLNEVEVKEFDPPCEVRALIEGQFLSMQGHAERFGLPSPPKRIIATGRASANQRILSSVAAIFGSDVYTVQKSGILDNY